MKEKKRKLRKGTPENSFPFNVTDKGDYSDR